MKDQIAIIIGAGPAGLTAAYELLVHSDLKPVVIEKSDHLGGISRTVNYKGNRMDIGGHRFFSKSDRIMKWWLDILPLETSSEISESENKDDVMLQRSRRSRIYFEKKFYEYPVSLSLQTIRNLGLIRLIKIGLSYIWIRIKPIRNERNLEDFFINRFGKILYETFFRDYTEKVWGVSCSQIRPEWGAQRIKGLSIGKAVIHMITKIFRKKEDIGQEKTETSLIERFLYPKYGPGQLWEKVGSIIRKKGGEIITNCSVTGINFDGDRIVSVEITPEKGNKKIMKADQVLSSMPVRDLIRSMNNKMPNNIREVAENLIYRDFITVGVLLKDLKIQRDTGMILKDNWIYIQENYVKMGRIQIFNNWSPYLVADKNHYWIGLEYFCNEGDELWNRSDPEMGELAVEELERIAFADKADVLDFVVIRIPKAYPAYFGSYERFTEIREYLDPLENLYLIGRNGMHRYNNMDHSMLSAITAVDCIRGVKQKSSVWEVNAESDYHEGK